MRIWVLHFSPRPPSASAPALAKQRDPGGGRKEPDVEVAEYEVTFPTALAQKISPPPPPPPASQKRFRRLAVVDVSV